MKINCEDFLYGGLSAEDSRRICKQAVFHGIDSIEVSGGGTSRTDVKVNRNEGYFQNYGTELQKIIPVPVISVGGYRSEAYINKILNETPLKYVALSRPLVREPDLPKRWKKGDSLVFPVMPAIIPGHTDVFLNNKVKGGDSVRYKYCPECGRKLCEKEAGDDGRVPFCTSCHKYWFDRFDSCVIVLVYNEYDEIVLCRQGYLSDLYTSFNSGYITPGETAEESAIREVKEELGLEIQSMEYAGIYWFAEREQLMRYTGFIWKEK